MILSNAEIQRAIDSGDLIIQPEPLPRTPSLTDPACPYDTTAVNLRLGDSLAVPITGRPLAFDLRGGGVAALLSQIYRNQTIDPAGGYALQPGSFVLGGTLERVAFPIREGRPCYAGRIEGRSSFSRCGLIVHFTAPTIHSGFDGKITLEMKNLGAYPIILYPGMEIAQLIVEQVLSTPFSRPSQFQGQTSPAGTQT